TDLVRATGIDRSTLADMVARMIAKGLLGRERSATDARANAVHLTADGRAVLNEARPRMAATDARLLALLSAGKREGFINQLRKLVQAGEAVGGAESEAGIESAAQDGVETVPVIARPKAKKSKGDKAKDGKKKKKGKRRADETPAA
ncbi:MAG TPA: MarR family winged helix-turn-helix transcriptional regulator, partial [Phenylobacterium sp.]|nr:MarR family winged helix-turn-helix transcriptional regulator [Phenylobacterium sp.]